MNEFYTNIVNIYFNLTLQIENSDGSMETITVPNGMHQMMIHGANGEPQVLQVLSLKDASTLTKAMAAMHEVKTDDQSMLDS